MKSLTEKQQRQLEKQLESHRHERYEVDIDLAEGHKLEGFVVHPNVLRPEKMTALYFARWLFYNNGLYLDKNVLDMGSGSGIQGVVMGLYGAKQIIFTDLSLAAVENSKKNIEKYNLGDKSIILQGDLFEKVEGRHDLIVFNHPFFSDHTIEQLLVSTSMLDKGKLIHRFFEDAKQYLTSEGVIVMPYFHVAGPINDPMIQAPQHGYEISERMAIEIKSGLQKGKVSVYEISLKNSRTN